jgi:hypothetical protein
MKRSIAPSIFSVFLFVTLLLLNSLTNHCYGKPSELLLNQYNKFGRSKETRVALALSIRIKKINDSIDISIVRKSKQFLNPYIPNLEIMQQIKDLKAKQDLNIDCLHKYIREHIKDSEQSDFKSYIKNLGAIASTGISGYTLFNFLEKADKEKVQSCVKNFGFSDNKCSKLSHKIYELKSTVKFQKVRALFTISLICITIYETIYYFTPKKTEVCKCDRGLVMHSK